MTRVKTAAASHKTQSTNAHHFPFGSSNRMMKLGSILFILIASHVASTAILDFERDFGAVANDASPDTCAFNTKLLSQVLSSSQNAALVLARRNRTLHFHNGVYGSNLLNMRLIVDGTLKFERTPNFRRHRHPASCLMLVNSTNVTLTSTHRDQRGIIDGQGSHYWGIPVIGYMELVEDRPRLFEVNRSTDLLIENLIFQDSPYHTIYLESIDTVTVRYVSVVARRTHADGHTLIDLTAFNTDGIDVSGTNVHVHDVDIWVQDDCIAVKDNYYPPYESKNMLFERVNCTGFGLVIGSIAGTHVSNITFRDAYLHKSVKGIYTKFREPGGFWNSIQPGSISNITYENIIMEAPIQWPIWIGPAQQSDQRDPCHGNPCSLCWPQNPFSKCDVVPTSQYRNITLSNIQINNPGLSPGVIMGGSNDNIGTIDTMVFHNVQVTNGPPVPAARQSRNVSFPGLNRPVHDKYVPLDQVQQISDGVGLSGETEALYMGHVSREQIQYPMFGFLIAIFMLASGTYWIWKYLMKFASGIGVSSRSKRRSVALVGLALFLIQSMILLSVVGQGWITPRWKRKSRYFHCEGVMNGIASGGTNPVPYCFEEVA